MVSDVRVDSLPITAFSRVPPDAINTPVSEIDPARVNTAMGNYKAYKEAGGTGSKLVYLKELRQAVADFVSQEIKPLLRA